MKLFEKLTNCIKERDIFAIPVQLTYKGQRKFNTVCGGCCTIILYLAIFISFTILLLHELEKPEVKQTAPDIISVNEADSNTTWTIGTNSTTFAVAIKKPTDIDAEKYVRVNFYQYSNDTDILATEGTNST